MGKIKKLKSNELVGGVDREDVYPITSTKAVFDDGNTSQDDINKNRLERIEDLEETMPTTVKSITINGGHRVNKVDENGNVDLTIYSDGGQDYEGLTEVVADLRDIVGENPEEPQSGTLLERVDTLEDAVGTGGSVDQRIENAINSLDSQIVMDYGDTNPHIRGAIQLADGKLARFELEEDTSDFDALYDYTHALNETDVIPGPKPSASNAQVNTIYRVPNDPSAGQYTDYMKNGNQMVPLATYDVAGEEAQVGCYVGTISGTALSVTAANNASTSLSAYILKNGGHFKIKVPSAATNTSGDWTLSMKGLAAKQLLYNGESVSSTNTWEANETISVYYDNTANSGNGAYFASNAQGGGGKAEKIKYDNSQSRLSAENVQEALDEIDNNNKKVDDYLYEDVKSLLLGHTYNVNEAVKTTDKQFRRITKEIKVLSLSETLTAGDIKTSGNATYRVDDAVDIYDPEGDYSENSYALGSFAEYIFTATAESITAGNITVNETEVAVEETDNANSIATKIADALVIDGWTTSVANNVVTVRCNTIGNNTTTITIDPDTENTGITVDESSIAGTNVIRKYDGESWATADVPTMETDGVIISVDEAWLIENATKQNTLDKDINWIDSLENGNDDFTWLTGNVTKYGDLVNTTSNKYAIFSKTALGENVTSFTVYCGGISGKSFWLYYQSGNKWYSKGSIKVGYTEFNVSNQSNFLILSYDNPTISQMEKCDIRVFRKTIVKDTVKDHESRITDLENNLSTEDVNYSSTVYTNDNNDFSWKTGNPSNPSAPSYANKYFTLNTGVEISKIKLVKTSSSYTFALSAKVGNSYKSLFSGKTSQNGIVDVSGKGYKVIYGLLWDKPSDADALAENITIEVTSNLRSKLDSMDASIAQAGGTYFTNPVIQSDSADPAVWWGEDGYWYLLATGNLSTKTMWRSANLVDWENTGETPFTQAAIETWTNLGNSGFWAPEIVKVGDKWNIYLSAGQNPMYVFTSKFPTYGFEYVGVIANHVLTLENIDACVRYDRDGTLWMFFDSYRQGMYRVKLNEDGTQMISGTMEHVAGLANDAEGNTNRAKTYEGAYLYRRKGYWYLIVSAGKYQDASYCLRVGRSTTLDGTFVDKNGNLMTEGNASLLLSASGTFYGTGHNGPIITDKQNRTWMLFHSHWTGASSTSTRPTCISEVLWDEDGWPYFTNNTLTVEGYGPKM